MAKAARPSQLSVETSEAGIAEFGPRAVRMVSHAAIVPFRQIRGDMAGDSLDELKRSIRTVDSDLRTSYNLVNALAVAELDEPHAEAYLRDLNAFWGTEYELGSLPFDDETGHYMFLVAGHRRWTGVGQIIKEDGLNPLTTRIAISPQLNINFAQAIVLQMQENTYERPSPTDQAEAIRLAYDFFTHRNARLTKARFARMIGRSSDVVNDALLYSELPDELKKWVKEKDISYTLAVMLGQIRSEYTKRFARMRDEGMLSDEDEFADSNAYADFEILTLGFSYRAMLQKSRRLTGKVNERAKEQLDTLRSQAKFRQEAFDLVLQVESARRRRLKAVHSLGAFSIKGLRAALREDPDLLRALQTADPDTVEMLRSGLTRLDAGVGSSATVVAEAEGLF